VLVALVFLLVGGRVLSCGRLVVSVFSFGRGRLSWCVSSRSSHVLLVVLYAVFGVCWLFCLLSWCRRA